MRKVTFGVANSLDNFIARVDDAVDWLRWTPEVSAIMSKFWKTIDTVIMCRRTYDIARKMGSSAYPGVKNVVFSLTLKVSPDPNVELVSGDAVGYLRKLKAGNGKGICVMGGGVLANSLLEADLIDEIGVNIHPVLLGSGIPLFGTMRREVELELEESKVLKNGCVYLLYRVKRSRERSKGTSRRPARGPSKKVGA
ncbi:MAG: dihydrofolate reductase family protein [Acidobacteriia bacterium]|nr:dihydrofolate reductase family protein [Terriglobia bacterium]